MSNSRRELSISLLEFRNSRLYPIYNSQKQTRITYFSVEKTIKKTAILVVRISRLHENYFSLDKRDIPEKVLKKVSHAARMSHAARVSARPDRRTARLTAHLTDGRTDDRTDGRTDGPPNGPHGPPNGPHGPPNGPHGPPNGPHGA